MKTAWLKLSAFGFVSALAASACVIKSGTDDGTGGSSSSTGGSKSTGGSSSTGGATATGGSKSTGGASSTGGAAATGGSKSTGGASSTGGAAATVACDNDPKRKPSTAADTCEFQDADLKDPLYGACLTCLSKATNCCDEVKTCYGTNPDDQCGFGGLDGESEYLCYQDCLVKKAKANGGDYAPDDKDVCADSCVTPACLPPPVGDATSVLIGCMHDKCDTECFVTPAM